MRKLKIDYITAHDPRDIRTWSGLNYFIMKALEAQGAEINVITNLHAKPSFGLKWRWHFYNLLGKNYPYERTHCYTRQFGAQVNAQLSKDADIVLATTSSALTYIKTDKPVFLYTDATFDNLAEYYDHFSRLPASSKRMGDAVERMAYANCAALLYSSKWAADSSVEFYKEPFSKVNVIPFGANLLQPPETTDILQKILQRDCTKIKLLWSGVEFKRKGGDIALEATRLLREMGVDATITLVGIQPEDIGVLPFYAVATGFLSKSDAAHLQIIQRHFEQAHFFIFPTSMDCSPVVLSEAGAYGLPCLTSNVSGIPTTIQAGKNGLLFSPQASAGEYANAIYSILQTGNAYIELATQSRKQYDAHLNWKTAAARILSIAENILQKN